MTTEEQRDVLRRAKEILLERGWYQGGFCPDFVHGKGPVCGIGALNIAQCGTPFSSKSSKASIALYAAGFSTRWNDLPETTLADVIACFDKALASLSPQPEEAVA